MATKTLTVAEAKLRKTEIEREISRLLADFEEQSGGIVTRIEVRESRQVGVKSPRIVIKAEIEL